MSNSDNGTFVHSYLDLPEAIFEQSIRILCKFVIIKHHDKLHLLWGMVSEYPYHANLVEKFCAEQGIPCSWANKPTMLELFDDQTQIRGGGYAEIKSGTKQIQFGGRSTAYGRFIRSDLTLLLEQNQLLDGFAYVYARD